MLGAEDATPAERVATKFSYLLGSCPPDRELLKKCSVGGLDSFGPICAELKQRIADGGADEFLREFPYGWLQLDRINFMAPDVDRYPLYEKKKISEDMVAEVLAFFRHAVTHNRPLPELLSANYSFVNADLAKVYDLDDVPSDSIHRKYVFRDNRRGGFLGMGAFLTLTADTLNTSPIHRAVYVMENFMGIHPAPPPEDVEIKEPDVRSARTIREVLIAHQSDATCAACHQNIDPFGYAFENFDPVGAWRNAYIDVSQPRVPMNSRDAGDAKTTGGKRKEAVTAIPIDASATFLSGAHYDDITQFREIMRNEASQKRFVRCFVTKLLTYANGIEPENFTEIESIVQRSAKHDYRIVETIAAVVGSPLFRETSTAVPNPTEVKHLYGAKLLLQKFRAVNATKDQLAAFDRLSAELTERVQMIRTESGITKELIKRRDKVYSELKMTELAGHDLWQAIQQRARLTDVQKDGFRETNQLNKSFRAQALGLLTEVQRSQLSKLNRPVR
jgi:ribosomal protein L9